MKRLIIALGMLAVMAGTAYAACPSWAPYGCKQGANGKVVCGCGG